MPLTKPAVSSRETERKIQELFYEFFKYYLSGNPVQLDGTEVTLPKCGIAFNADSLPGTPDATGLFEPTLHLIFSDIQPLASQEAGGRKLILSPFLLTAYVRAGKPAGSKQSPDQFCRDIADAVKQLIETEAGQFAEKGIKHLHLLRGPLPLSTPGIATRILTAKATILYRSN